jgi:hypothetical protein
MPTARTKPAEVTYLPVRDITEMVNALAGALTIGYRGQISAYIDPKTSEPIWQLELHGPEGVKPVISGLGSVLVWENTFLRSLTIDEFSGSYEFDPSDTKTAFGQA